ncbi:hypothetical protein [Yoonia sediminilitoris]|nr:hypothetical protein [Yoonia sediminilitoris]
MQMADQIDTIGRNVATFYEPVVADMHQVRMQARHFEKLTESLKVASLSSGLPRDVQDASTILHAATCLRDVIGKARDTVSDPRLQNIFNLMQSHCDHLLRCSKELNSLSFLMLVTTASAAESGFTIEHLVTDLREMAKQLNTTSSDISSTLSVVDAVRQDTAKVLFDTYKVIDVTLEDLDAPAATGPSQRVERVKGETPEHMAERLSADLGRLLPGLVACMQHPDAFAQRCAHIAEAIRLLDEDLNEDTDLALRTLVIAQLDDICEELDLIQADALRTLRDIAEKGTGTLELFHHHLKNDTRLNEIDAEKQKLTDTSGRLTQIKNRSQAALADLSECVKRFYGVESIFNELDAMREGVRISALNADLSERRAEINMPELRSVTEAVGDCATACGTAIRHLGDLYKEIHHVFEQIDETAIDAAIDVVENVLAASHASLDALSGQLETIHSATADCSKALTELVDLGNSAHARIASNVMAAKQLLQIANDLGSAVEHLTLDPEKVDGGVMSRVFDTYSIETERKVHYRVLPPKAENETKSQEYNGNQESDDPLEGLLF